MSDDELEQQRADLRDDIEELAREVEAAKKIPDDDLRRRELNSLQRRSMALRVRNAKLYGRLQ